MSTCYCPRETSECKCNKSTLCLKLNRDRNSLCGLRSGQDAVGRREITRKVIDQTDVNRQGSSGYAVEQSNKTRKRFLTGFSWLDDFFHNFCWHSEARTSTQRQETLPYISGDHRHWNNGSCNHHRPLCSNWQHSITEWPCGDTFSLNRHI